MSVLKEGAPDLLAHLPGYSKIGVPHNISAIIRNLEKDNAQLRKELDACVVRITNTPPGENGKTFKGREAVEYLLAECARLTGLAEDHRVRANELVFLCDDRTVALFKIHALSAPRPPV